MRTSLPTLLWQAGAAFTVGALVALSGSGPEPATLSPGPAVATTPPAATPPAATPPATTPPVLRVASTALGPVAADSAGRTLYRTVRDGRDPPASRCLGACAELFVPVLADASGPVAAGIDRGLVGVVARPGGGSQLTYAGWPMYRFSRDTGPGQANGQGFNGTWHALTPGGRPVS
jgi:predicted lipoprotein with Yx(FWY)xxD motif